MSRKLRFEHEFTDYSATMMSYAADTSPESKANVYFDNGVAVLSLTKRCCGTLARIFAQLSLGSLQPGFHLHLGENLHSEDKEILRIELISPDE